MSSVVGRSKNRAMEKVTIKNGKFVMPDEDVVLTGSFEAAEQTYQVRYVDEDTKTDILPMSAPKAAHF